MRSPCRRERLLALIKPWADCRREWVLRLGDWCIEHDALTDVALEDVAHRICVRFWSERRINRQNRALRAAQQPEAGT